jgi:hypothetical protein
VPEQNNQPALKESTAVFACGGVSYTDRDVIDATLFRGELEPIWRELLRNIECEDQADELEIDKGVLDKAAEALRYDHDLITAEETEHWLETRGLTLDDFGEYFARRYWGENWEDEVEPKSIDYVSASEELRDLLRADIILSGEFDKMAKQLSWRVAASFAAKQEDVDPESIATEEKFVFERVGIDGSGLTDWLAGLGRDREWLNEMLRMEAILRRKRDQLLTPRARQSELATLRLPLTRFEVEIVEVESKDAAREASLCVTADGLSMEEVAKEGRYPFRRVELLLQDIDNELQQKFLSVSVGKVLEPLAREDGFQLCRIINKIEPNADDPVLRERIDQSILERHFSQLVANHIQWQGPLNYAQ